jgi:hypothetical protein
MKEGICYLLLCVEVFVVGKRRTSSCFVVFSYVACVSSSLADDDVLVKCRGTCAVAHDLFDQCNLLDSDRDEIEQLEIFFDVVTLVWEET